MGQTGSRPVWMTLAEAGRIAPGLAAARLQRIVRAAARDATESAPPASILSDGEIVIDELAYRRWLESTVSDEWAYGPVGSRRRTPPSEHRRYAYQDAGLTILRSRTYVTEGGLQEVLPEVPLWRIRDLRFRGVGPRFLKPTPRTVIYIAEEARDWADGVSSFADPLLGPEFGPLEPYTPAPRHLR